MFDDFPNADFDHPASATSNTNRRKLLIEQLEDRVLFDAVPIAPVEIPAGDMDAAAFVESSQFVEAESGGTDLQAEQQSANEVVFVDKSVEGFEEIVAEFVGGRELEVFFINSGSAGLKQIAEHLDGRTELGAIHIISHGQDAQLFLGDSAITTEDLSGKFTAELRSIGQSLSSSGDILIYGCELAANDDGEQFIRTLSEITEADVAASDDLTGNSELGGDWELEKNTGTIEAKELSATKFEGVLIETDAGFVVGTATFGAMNEVAVTPVSEGGVSSRDYASAATANGGSTVIDIRLTLVDTYDEFGNVTTGTANQLPVTFSDFAGGPVLLARNVGVSVSGFEGHVAHVMVEFFDAANGNPLSVVGEFTFKDIDYEAPTANGSGSEAVTVISDQMQSYSLSNSPATSLEMIENGNGTTTFTNTTTRGSEADQDRWVSIKFNDMPQLNLRFTARNANTGYGLSTANFASPPLTYSQPNATDDNFTTTENTVISGNVVAGDNGNGSDNDPEGDTLTVSEVNGAAGNVGTPVTGSAGGLFTIQSDGAFDFDPGNDFDYLAAGESVITTVSYQVNDGTSLTDNATVSVTVIGTNDTPNTLGTIPNQSSNDSQSIAPLDVSGYFGDVDASDLITYDAGSTLPPGLVIDPVTGIISGTLNSSASLGGPFTVVITANDGNAGTVTQSFTWAVSNLGPTAADNAASVWEDVIPTDSGNVIVDDDGFGSDVDPDGDVLSVSAVEGSAAFVGVVVSGNYGDIVINSDGNYLYTLDHSNPNVFALDTGDTLTESFTYSITDGEGGTSSATLTITINGENSDPLLGGTIPAQSGVDSEAISTLDVSGYFSDPEGLTLSYSALNLPLGLAIDPSTGEISGTLDSSASSGGAAGVYHVTVTATDNVGQSASTTFDWTVSNPAPAANDDSFIVNEDAVLTSTVAANDLDSDGDALTFSPVSAPSNGSLVFNPDGSFTYAPNQDFFGTDSFDYQVVDADGSTSTATVTINVGSVNDPPVVDSPIADQANSDSELISLDVSGNFSDVEGDSLTFSATGLPTGLSIDASSGLISGTLDSSASAGGPYTVVITADDGNGGTVTDTFTWSVANPGPMAGDDSFSTSEDTPLSGSVAGNDSDADGDVLTFNALTSPVNGSLVFNPDGSFTYTPDSDFHGTESFDYQIVDADGSTSTATVTINVVSVNDPPVVDSPIADQANSDSELISLDVSGNFSDVEGDSLTFSATGLPTGLSIDPSTGLISGTLDSSASAGGPYTVVITADDGNGGTVTDTFTWNVANPGPMAGDDSFSTSEDTPLSGSVAGNDTDVDGDALTFNTLSSPVNGSLVFNSDGSFTYTPDSDFHGSDSFDYEIVDADGSISMATVTINVGSVNDPPVVDSPIADQSNSDSEVISLDVSGNFSDVEGDSLTFGATGLPTGLSIDPSTGLISGTLDSSASAGGPYTVVITADDGNGGTVTDTFTWNVANPGPMAGNDSFSTSEDTPLSGSVAGNDTDSDGDVLTFNALTSPSNGSLVFNPDGSFTYTPDPDFHGSDSFDYEIVDADGSTSTATVTINVGSVNDPPVVDSPIADQANSDSEVISLDVSGNFSDVEGDSLTFGATGLPAGLSLDPSTGLISGTLDSSASAGGPYTVVITADDGNGGTVTDTFTWSVANPGPMAGDDSFSTSEDTPLSGSVAGNDTDVDGDALTFNTLSSPVNGSLVFNSDGSFTYTPDSDFHGSDSFDYEIVDADGSISMATVTINVGSVNDPPVVDSPIADQSNNDSEVISLDVSGNFSDVEGDSLTFSATGLPTGLSIDASTGLISGTLDSSASAGGPYTVVITADDGNGGTVTDTFTWSVANPGPTAGDDSFSTSEDTPLSGSVAGNDTDSDGDVLTFNALTSPSNGSLVFNPDGSFTYTPDPDFHGSDSFDYEIVDADGSTSTATVTINVVSVNDPPVVDSPIADQANSDSEFISLDVSGNFSDVEGDSLTFSATGLPTGLSIDPSTGLISGTLDSSASAGGPYTVVITADDGNGGTVTDTFTWSVANPGPTAGNDSISTSEDTPLSGSVAGNDSDADGDALTFNALSSPANGSLVFNPDGSFTYTPDSDFHGSDSFDYEIVDADGSISMATVTIHVGSVNDPPVVDSPIADQANSDSEFISLDVSGNFSDVEGDSLTFGATGLPAGLSIDPSTGLISGTLDSSASAGGPYTVVITADDGNGGTVTDTFTWSVANPGPTAGNDSFSTSEDTPLSGSVAGNDSDADGDALTFNALSSPANGSLVFNPDGSFTYTPDSDFHGSDSFDYEIVDADGFDLDGHGHDPCRQRE